MGFYLYSKNLASMPDQIIRQAITHPLFSFLSELGCEDSYKEITESNSGNLYYCNLGDSDGCLFWRLMLELLMYSLWSEFGRNFQILGVFSSFIIIFSL